MSVISSDVMDRARKNYLNDANATLYDNDTLLPLLQAASEELGQKLEINGISVQKTVATTYNVDAGDSELTPLPDDIIVPVTLWARPEGQTGEANYVRMNRTTWPAQIDETSILGPWNWREQKIRFTAATLNYTVKLEYNRLLLDITGNNSPVEAIGSKNFLAARTAEAAARFIGQNSGKADQIAIEAMNHLNDLILVSVHNSQSLRARRKPFRTRRFWRLQ